MVPSCLTLACLFFLALPAASAQPLTPAERLDAVARAAHEAGRFDGIVLAAEGDRTVYHAAFGRADRAWDVPLTPETRVPIASVTKQIVAVLTMRLVERGVLDLDQPVDRYAPGLIAAGDRVTLRHLLQHRSGLPDTDAAAETLFRCPLDPTQPDTLGTPEAVAAAFMAGPLDFEPGSRFRYNNGDYLVLEAVLARATGKPFEELLREEILAPLAMDDTRLARWGQPEPRLARSYLRADDGTDREACVVPSRYGAGAALVSTAADVLRFDRALLGGRLLSDEARAVLWDASPETAYAALGQWVYEKALPDGRQVRVVERQGMVGGFHLLNVLLPDDDRALVVFRTAGDATLDGLAWQPGLADDLVRALYGFAPSAE